MKNYKIMIKLSYFILGRISIKFNVQKLKKLVDLGFIIIEKIVVKLNKLLLIYLDFNEKMIENEINLAKISKNDKILHIGCGSIPATSILLAKKIGANITAIDNDFYSVKKARVCLSKFKFLNNVQIKHAEADTFPVEMFDLIIISQGVTPYYETLKHIAKSLKSNARVIFRTSSTRGGYLFESDMFLKDIFIVDKIVYQKQNGLLLSILLLKKS